MMPSLIHALAGLVRMRRYPNSAETWLVRVQSGRMTQRDEQALSAWLNADPRHAAEYSRCQKLAQLGARLRSRPELVHAMPAYRALHERPQRQPIHAWLPGPIHGVAAAGACALVVLVAGAALFYKGAGTTFTTAHGEQRQLFLEDGSEVYINTDSSIRVAFSRGERRVEIQKGEVYFEVTKNPNRPFIVGVGASEVRVIGTKFDIRRSDEQIVVVVAEGRVQVRPGLSGHAEPASEDVLLLPGNALTIDRAGDRIELASVDPERTIAWRKGTIEFDSATLAEVIEEVNRYTRKPFVIADEQLKTLRVSGRFNVGDIDSVQFALKNRFSIRTEFEGNKIILLKQATR
jgi:transmembrane sensor